MKVLVFKKSCTYFETASKVMVHHTIFSNPTPIIQSSDNSQQNKSSPPSPRLQKVCGETFYLHGYPRNSRKFFNSLKDFTIFTTKLKLLRILGSYSLQRFIQSINLTVVVSVTKRRRDIKIPFCLSAPVRKSFIQ